MARNTNKKSIILFAIIIIAVIALIVTIIILKTAPKIDEQIVKCIASKSHMYGSSTCTHCTDQKKILGNYISLFNITDCYVDIGACTKENIEYFPTWIIGGEKYIGVKSIAQLKNMTGC